MKIALYTSWKIELDDKGQFYFPYTHYVYTKFASTHFDKVLVVVSVEISKSISSGFHLLDLSNVIVITVPYFNSFLSAQKYVLKYYSITRLLKKEVDLVYCRAHSPYSWMPAFFVKKKIIMHFVGDAINATLNNEKWSKLKKIVMILGYYPDYFMTMLAARRSLVFANGENLSRKISRFGVNVTPVISSILFSNDFNDNLPVLPQNNLTLIYVGYLRNAKGIGTLISTIKLLEKNKLNYLFHIVGDGEMFTEIKLFIERHNLIKKVILHGHIDDRIQLNNLLRSSDLFIFPSLSEGSPRVVIEAMSQGIPVLSTPVGSLPTTFENLNEIHFFDFNDPIAIKKLIESYISDNTAFINARDKAYQKVKEKYTVENFLTSIFQL